MDAADLQVRNETYRLFVANGRAPTLHEVAQTTGRDEAEVAGAWSRLHDAHALVLDASRRNIRMANPFAAAPTAYRVFAGARWWYANCAWDAFGICAALASDGRIETSCPDCGGAIRVGVVDRRPVGDQTLFHCLVPASSWWDDIAFT